MANRSAFIVASVMISMAIGMTESTAMAQTVDGVSCELSNPRGAQTTSYVVNRNDLAIWVSSVHYTAKACRNDSPFACADFEYTSFCGAACFVPSMGTTTYNANTRVHVPEGWSVQENTCVVNFNYVR